LDDEESVSNMIPKKKNTELCSNNLSSCLPESNEPTATPELELLKYTKDRKSSVYSRDFKNKINSLQQSQKMKDEKKKTSNFYKHL